MNKRWIIKWNKENNPTFKPITYSPCVHSNPYIPDYAIDSNPSSRFSSKLTKDPWWSVTLPRAVYAFKYMIQEPDYGAGSQSVHQKTWKLFGSKHGTDWKEIDYRENMSVHNSKSYIGTYEIKNHGPFVAFKILTVESYAYNQLLTFAEFDVYGSYRFLTSQGNVYHANCLIFVLVFLIES